jgi:hypothetical protein
MKKINNKNIKYVTFVCALIITIFAGRWAQGLFLESEFVHFSINFPTVEGAESIPLEDLGGPWTMLEENEWDGYPAGGLLVWGREEKIVVDVGKQGIIKHLMQPRDVTLSTHWLRNVGTRPFRIRLDIDMCQIPVEWATFETYWDDITKESTREIIPGSFYNMDWHFKLPPDWKKKNIICEGGIKVLDAESDKLLTFLPIHIINSQSNAN